MLNPVVAGTLPVAIPAKLWFLSKTIVGDVEVGFVTDETSRPIPKVVNNLLVVSLVILFLRSSVWTSPSGDLNA